MLAEVAANLQIATAKPPYIDIRRLIAALLVVTFALAASAQQKKATTPAQEWQTYNHDLAGTRFSPLTEINTGNVAKLAQAWIYKFPRRPAAAGAAVSVGASEAVPIVVGGVMYLPVGNSVVALEADTGKVIWQRDVPGGPQAARCRAAASATFPAIATRPTRIIVTAGRRLLSFDAATGKPSEGFGTNGEVDMVVGYAGHADDLQERHHGRRQRQRSAAGARPATRARSMRSPAGSCGSSTPCRGRAKSVTRRGWTTAGRDRSGTNTWGFSETVDEARGIAYLPIAGPAANYYGGDRPGNNLFGNSVVAVDIATGKYKWHFQTVHHDIWDIDMSAAPGPGRHQAGRPHDSRARDGRQGRLHVHPRSHDRQAGVRRRGAAGAERQRARRVVFADAAVPGEAAGAREDQLQEGRHGDRRRHERPNTSRACQALWDKSGGFTNEGPFTPFTFHEDGAPPKSTISFPGGTGGVNWGGTATDPRTGYIYVNSHDTSLVGWVEKKKPGVNYSFDTRRLARCSTIARRWTASGRSTRSPRRRARTPTAATSTFRASVRHGRG